MTEDMIWNVLIYGPLIVGVTIAAGVLVRGAFAALRGRALQPSFWSGLFAAVACLALAGNFGLGLLCHVILDDDLDAVWLTVLSSVGFGAVLMPLWIGAMHLKERAEERSARPERTAGRQRLDRVWAESIERHNRLRDQWFELQHDIDQVLSLPSLADVNEPTTAAFIEALGDASDLAAERQPTSADAVRQYATATRIAEARWNAAIRHARQDQASRHLSPGPIRAAKRRISDVAGR